MTKITIDSVEITNFKCIKHRFLKFDSNINVLYGRNGVGKTSVLDAIFYAFRPEVPSKELIRYGNDEANLVVNFKCGKDDYQIIKVLKRFDSSRTNLYGPNVRIRGSKAVAEKVKELGIGRLYTDWWYVTQASIVSLIQQLGSLTSKNKVINFVETLFGLPALDHFLVTYEKYRNLALISSEKDREIIFKTKLDDAQEQLKKFEQLLTKSKIEKEYNELSETLSAIESRIQSPEAKLVISYKRYQEIIEDSKRYEKLIQEARQKQKENLEKLTSLISPYRTYLSGDLKLSVILDRCENLKTRIIESVAAKKEIAKAYANALQLFRSRPHYPKDYSRKIKRYNELFHEVNKYQNILSELVIFPQKECPICERELTPETHETIKSRYNQLTAAFEELSKWYEECSQILKDRTEIKRRIREIHAFVKRLKLRLMDIEENVEGVERWYKDVEAVVGEIEKANEEIMKLENQKRLSSAQLSVVEEILHSHPKIDLTLNVEELIKKRDELRSQLEKIKPEYLEIQHAKMNFQAVLDSIKELEAKLEDVKRKQELYDAVCRFIESFKVVFTECSFHFIKDQLIRLINNHLLRYDCGFILELRENPFGFVVKFLNGSEVALAQLSFGQKVFTSLVFLLTLHKVIPVHQFILIDEPLLGLDTSNREAFVEIMENYDGFIIAATATNPFGNIIELH